MISIIIPIYNAENYIKRCINSLLNQSYQNYEIILIDDGSKDNSRKVLKEFEGNKKIRIYFQENIGVAKTRNKGIKLAKGEYITFIDNDDYIDSDYLEKLYNNIQDNDIIISGYRRVNDKKVLSSNKLKDTEWSKYIIIAPWAKIYKKEFLIVNKIEFLSNNIGEDVYFNLIAYFSTDKIKIIPYIGYNWYFNDKSVSNTIQKSMNNDIKFIYLLNKIYEELIKRDFDVNNELFEFYIIRYCIWYLLFSSKKCDYNILISEYKKIFEWLSEKYPNYKKNKNINLFKPYGETFKNRFIINTYMFLNKIKLDKQFLKVYSKL